VNFEKDNGLTYMVIKVLEILSLFLPPLQSYWVLERWIVSWGTCYCVIDEITNGRVRRMGISLVCCEKIVASLERVTVMNTRSDERMTLLRSEKSVF